MKAITTTTTNTVDAVASDRGRDL